jgi:LmbE family N-acetylglucosaminyl deacetylase
MRKRILAMGAHPDDIELEAGGTLLKWALSGHEIYLLAFSSGAYTDLSGKTYQAKERKTEMEKASKLLNVKKVINLGYKDTEIPSDGKAIREIDGIITDLNPDIIISHHPFDSHQDHRTVAEIMFTVARRGRVGTALSCAPLPYRPNVFAFRPQYFSDITSTIERKLDAIRLYKSQYKKYDSELWIERIRAMATFWGWAIDVRYAECFEILRQNDVLL